MQITAQKRVWSATVAAITGTLHQHCEDCTMPTGHVLWALAASDGLAVKNKQSPAGECALTRLL